ncbi:MAG: type I DNA topoisomerase [Dehalococcoidia bacterium]|nr:type I DNA topoisomerase [Dehalococcoidia bacterium]
MAEKVTKKKTATKAKATTSRRKPAAAKKARSNGTRAAQGANLVVVESPTKARTIGRFLGSGYHVIASMGHVRDLPKGKFGVEVENGFEPQYVVSATKKAVLKEIKDFAATAPAVFLATDPDREGEAISWHLVQAAGIRPEQQRRVVFHEITEAAIKEAFEHPRDIDMKLVEAQQARRILDRLVGYQLSPLLWKKVQRGLSAGRVQSVALRLIVERDRQIEAFVPVEYWSIDALLRKAADSQETKQFTATLHSVVGDKERIDLPNGDIAHRIEANLQGAGYAVTEVTRREIHRRPTPPFITSTLQQEGNRKLRWVASRTMAIAQQLYEGVTLGAEGSVGLITYMRTDSTDVSASALQETLELVRQRYGAEYAPEVPRLYTRKVKGAQEAHEAIRPTSVRRSPDSVRQYLSPEQHRLYELIWQRMVASQMNDAVLDSTSVDITAVPTNLGRQYLFRATGTVLKFPGFRAVYMEGLDDASTDDKESNLPELAQGDPLDCLKLDPQQHFTQPPPRFTEASLIKALEERGIGRPSTYAPIVGTIVFRNYVERERGSLHSTKLGQVVSDQLTGYFPVVMDYDFTAKMEEELDDIASGERQRVPVLKEFYDPFEEALKAAQENMPRVKVEEPTNEVCELCGKPMVIKTGRFGPFLSCSGFPECKNSRPVVHKIGVLCPNCGGELVQRKARKGGRGSTFYGCSNYPTCNFASNAKPVSEPCPECGGMMVEAGRNAVRCTKCSYRDEAATKEPAAESA